MTLVYGLSVLCGMVLGFTFVRLRFAARWYWLASMIVALAGLQVAWIVIGWWWVAPVIVGVLFIVLAASGIQSQRRMLP